MLSDMLFGMMFEMMSSMIGRLLHHVRKELERGEVVPTRNFRRPGFIFAPLARERRALAGPAGLPAGGPGSEACRLRKMLSCRPDQIVNLDGPPMYSGTVSCSGVLFGLGMKTWDHIANSCSIHLIARLNNTEICILHAGDCRVVSLHQLSFRGAQTFA